MYLIRIIDVAVSITLFLIVSPLIFIFSFLIFVTDYNSPLYIADRVGRNAKVFKMVKLRSMVINADKIGPETTKSTDERITKIGSIVRKFKIDELMQLYNVIKGDMSLVGPRPNTCLEVKKYDEFEKKLLAVKPGITDFASIIFSNENEILRDSIDPVADYDTKIRPWKLKFGLLFIKNISLRLYFSICVITFLSIMNRTIGLILTKKLCNTITNDKETLSFLDMEICRSCKLCKSIISKKN